MHVHSERVRQEEREGVGKKGWEEVREGNKGGEGMRWEDKEERRWGRGGSSGDFRGEEKKVKEKKLGKCGCPVLWPNCLPFQFPDVLCFLCPQDTKVMDTWFSVDTRPFKQALLTVVKKWSFMFKQHLIDHVTNRQVALYMMEDKTMWAKLSGPVGKGGLNSFTTYWLAC